MENENNSIIKVVVCGPESTGKSTLAKQLADYYKTPYVPEYCRIYLDKKKQPLTVEDVLPIAEGQQNLEEGAAKKAKNLLICNTDIRQTRYYSQHYYQTIPNELEQMIKRLSPRLYLILTPDVPWVADSQRDRPHLREQMFEEMKKALIAEGCQVDVISGTWKERWDLAVRYVTKGVQNWS